MARKRHKNVNSGSFKVHRQTLLYGHPFIIQTPHYYGQFALPLGKKALTSS